MAMARTTSVPTALDCKQYDELVKLSRKRGGPDVQTARMDAYQKRIEILTEALKHEKIATIARRIVELEDRIDYLWRFSSPTKKK
jgi:hypothetical protein